MAASEVTSVRVAARLRPLNAAEARDGCVNAVTAFPETGAISLGSGAAEKKFGYVLVVA